MAVTIARHCVGSDPETGLSPLQQDLLTRPEKVRIADAPTGAGKSYAFQRAMIAGERVLFIVPTRRLAQNLIAGLQRKIQDVAKKGNLKDFFHVQEVPPEQEFRGAVFGLDGFDPFAESGETELVIRIGLHRNGMVRLARSEAVQRVRLNAATAALFDRELPVERYCLHSIQLTPPMDLDAAAEEVIQWR